jgi:hypothetical protein
MRKSLYILLLISALTKAQDKLFFKNGTLKQGVIVSNGKDFVFFRTSDTSRVEKILKTELLMIESYKGTRFIFKNGVKSDSSKPRSVEAYRNSMGIQPLEFFLGRITVVYERLSKDQKIGIVIPFSLAFDPANIFKDTSINTGKAASGIKFVAGADLNFYLGKKDHFKFFVGPRFRYGSAMIFGDDIEGYTLQTQFGWRLGGHDRKMSQHFSIGYGFVRLTSTPPGMLIDPKQINVWWSVNYRVGINW